MVCLDRLADRQGIPGHKHIVKGNIPLAVRRRPFDQGNSNLRQFIIEKFFSIHLYIFHQRIINGNPVDPRSFLSGIHKNIQSYFGKSSRQSSRLGPDSVGNAAQRQVISLKSVFQHQFFRTEHCSEMTADQPVHCSFPDIAFCIMFFVPDTKACAGNDGQMPGRLHSHISPVNGFMKLHRIFNPHKRIDTNTVSVPDQPDRLICAHDLIHNMSPPVNIMKIILAESFSKVQQKSLVLCLWA